MITDHFAEGKHFFVAKILSKNVNWAAAATTSVTQGANSNAQIAPSFEHPPPSSTLDKDIAATSSTTAASSNNNSMNFSHFFNAYGILKLLFKKRGGEFIGRFHDRYPITVKNPKTNCVSSQTFRLSLLTSILT